MKDHLLGSLSPASTVIAAIIGASILWFTARRSAKIELAKFRLDWIENLREDLSEFQSLAMKPEYKPHTNPRFYELGTRIELRLNPVEKDHKALIDVMYAMLEVSDGTVLEKYSKNPEFVKISQKIIKTEWDRVQDGLLGKDMSSRKKRNA